MTLVDIPTEQTTAATDAVLAGLSVACVLCLQRFRGVDAWRVGLWCGAFSLLAVSAVLGAVVHGVSLPSTVRAFLWHPLYLTLGFLVAIFCVAAVNDLFGQRAAAQALPVAASAAILFFVLSRTVPGGFELFVVYEAVLMSLCLAAYVWLALVRRRPGAGWLAAGIGISLFAAWLQTRKGIQVQLVWEFDANGVFHLVQMPGVVLVLVGLCQALQAARSP